jgi:4,5-DOPA dioxygenase extradiol
VQLSLARRPPAFHYALAQRLTALRDEGVLILGSGNIVHNLRLWGTRDPAVYQSWNRFNDAVKQHVGAGDHNAVVDYESLTPEAKLSVPTPEHYLPLLYVLGVKRPSDAVTFFNDEDPTAIFMTSMLVN